MPRLPFGEWVDSGVDWLQNNLAWLFDAISAVVKGLDTGINAVLTAPEPLLLAGIFAVIAWWLRGLLAGVLSFVGFGLIISMELWDDAMATLSLVLVATLVAIVLSVPLGIWAARSRTVSAVLRPVLDFMQTMPGMVYLLPAVIFFGLGAAPGIVATIIFAMPPGVRMTELGIRQVDKELVEAAEAFGTTPRNTLLRVQLPLALSTIMAGVNQVIMLGLSMVVIAGMVGAAGLGSSVYEGISQLNIGLGFEAGVSIVILAIYLDRLTSGLGQQVSPVGRRAIAKARTAAAGGKKIWSYRPQTAVAMVGVVVLALIAGGMGALGSSDNEAQADSGNVGQGREINIGYIPWDEGIASTFLWKEMLEQRGFKVNAQQYEAGALYTGMANGEIDFETDSWLPTTHESYWKKYGDKLEDMGSWYGPTSLEIAVPSYMKGIESMEDLKGQADKFKGRIVGIEPGAGEMQLLKSKVLKEYGLDKEFKVVDGSTPAMLAELKRAYAKKEPIAVTLWSPHWAYNEFDLTKLKDPKGAWGEGDEIHTLARKGFSKEFPEVGKWLKDFKMSEEQLTSLEAEIQGADKGKEQDAVRAWLKDQPKALDTWAPVSGGDNADIGKGREINVGYIPWDEGIASTFLWKEMLEQRGFKVNAQQYEAGALYTGMANGEIDFETDSWLPTTHESYWKKYGDKLEDMGSWYGPTSLEIAVPSYVKGIESMEDLKGQADKFKGRIVGIEPGAGEMQLLKSKVLKEYGLDKEFKVVDGSTPAMLAELKRAYAKKEPIAVTLWSPHWAYNEFDLTKLKDPEGAWGEGDEIHTLARKGFSKEFPEVGKWLKDFKMSEEQLTSLEAEIQGADKGKEQDAVRAWLKDQPDALDKWAPVSGGDSDKKKDVAAEAKRPMEVAWFPWEEDIAATYLWKHVLEDRGYKMNLHQFEVGPMYAAMSRGQIDVQFDAWLPNTQKKYWDKYQNELVDLGDWYGPTSLELAVPDYVKDVKSLADLKGKGEQFDGRIVGIEAGTETMDILKNKVVPGYGLSGEYKVVDSSTPGMLAELKRAYAKKEPIAVMLWTPHWAYNEYKLNKLEDPKKLFGEGDQLRTVAHKSFTENYPVASDWFRDFELSEDQLAGLENEIQKLGTGKEEQAVDAWLKENPEMVDKLAPM
ncbi:ABC transporter permease/substrate binding protein [Streptomyces albidoflavus]